MASRYMKAYGLIASGLCLAGCMANNALQYDAVAYNNIYHIAKIQKGMNEREVLCIMRKPFSYETFELGEDIYDVWFYVTQTTVLDQSRMVPRNLTPLTFKNGILVGTGYDYYYFVVKATAPQVQKPPPTPPPPIREPVREPENKELEKILETSKQPENPGKVIPLTPPPSAEPKPPISPSTPKAAPHQLPAQKADAMPLKKGEPLFSSNNTFFSHVKKGMTEAEVINLVGEPSSLESYQIGNDIYDIWFYQSGPLTFKNSVLVGTTQEYYESIKEASGQTECIDCYDKEAEQMQQEESEQNFNFW